MKENKRKDYFIVESWMIDLFQPEESKRGASTDWIKVNIFAYIYSFSRDGESKWYGNQRKIADLLKINESVLSKKLKELVDSKFLDKEEIRLYGMFHHNNYTVNEKYIEKVQNDLESTDLHSESSGLYSESSGLHSESTVSHSESINNNINNYNNNYNNKNNISSSKEDGRLFIPSNPPKKKKLNKFDKCFNKILEYTNDKELQDKLVDYLKVRLNKYSLTDNQWDMILEDLTRFGKSKIDKIKLLNYAINNNYGKIVQPPYRKSLADSEHDENGNRIVFSGRDTAKDGKIDYDLSDETF